MSLDDKLNAWAKGAGKEKVQRVAMAKVDVNALTRSLVACIQSVIPPVLAGGFTAYPTVDKSDDGTITISLEFGNKPRSSFTDAVYDIYGLFTQGWSYDKRPPYGLWHGQWIRAWPTRAGQAFVQSGVDTWKASLGSGITVQSDYINPLYR